MQALTEVRNAVLWKVSDNDEQKLAAGLWSTYVIDGVAYSQVGAIQWQLARTSPCLKPADGSYVFALSSEPPQTYYVVNIPDDLPQNEIDALETALTSFTAFQRTSIFPINKALSEQTVQVDGQQPSRADQVVAGIGKTATYAVQGLTYGALALSKTIKKGGEVFKENTTKTEEEQPVDDKTKKRIGTAKNVAQKASAVAAVAVDAVSGLTAQVASAIVSATTKKKEGGSQESSTSVNAKKVGAAAAVAAAEVYEAMEQAFRIVARSSADATTTMVEHKYGKEYGAATSDALDATGYSADAVLSARRIGPKAVLKTAAKKTAVQYISHSSGSSHNGRGETQSAPEMKVQ